MASAITQPFFNTPVYGTYLSQLKEICDHCDTKLANRIKEYSPTTPQGNHEFYKSTIEHIRQRIRKIDEETLFLKNLISWMYNAPELLDAMIDVVKKYMPKEVFLPLNQPISSEIFVDVMQKTFQATIADPDFMLRKSLMDDMHDPHYWGNPPYYLCKMGKTRFIRMPNVLRAKNPQNKIQSPDDFHVIEEFYHYLGMLEDAGKKHLYVNFVSMVKHDEGKMMVQKIMDLEKDPKFNGQLYVVTLDKDSPFYYQTNDYENRSDAREFKQTFLEFLFANYAYRWSIHMDPTKWKDTCRQLIDEIHIECFDQKPQLDKIQRQDFIEIMIARIIQHLIVELDVDSCNPSCKNSTDRGPGAFSLTYLDYRRRTKDGFLGKHFYRILAVSLAQPLLIQNRPAHDERIRRLISAAGRLLSIK